MLNFRPYWTFPTFVRYINYIFNIFIHLKPSHKVINGNKSYSKTGKRETQDVKCYGNTGDMDYSIRKSGCSDMFLAASHC